MIRPEFDELHVISDLHLGGEKTASKNFQIFNQGERLGKFIMNLSGREPGKNIALLLNGDIVDFLAEPGSRYLDPDRAVDKLSRIYNDPSFSPVWGALEAFVATPNRSLILVLGNHDVELALPPVKNWLCSKLTREEKEAQGRVIFAMDGAGFSCEVGNKKILCVHGNEVDGWNVVDYFKLLQVSRALNRGKPPEEWEANAGTRMVIDVMNSVKKDFPMVDLLKPEQEAAVPILVALDPEQITKLLEVGKLALRAKLTEKRIDEGLLGAQPEEEEKDHETVSAGARLKSLLQESFGEYKDDADDIAALLLRADRNIEKEVDPRKIGDGDQQLGWMGDTVDDIVKWFKKVRKKTDPVELLRKALQTWVRDDVFEYDGPDSVLDELKDRVGPSVDYLIAGHSHLARARTRVDQKHYYNSGTWIRLIQLTDAVLEDPAAFEKLLEVLKVPDIGALDNATIPGGGNTRRPLVKDDTTYAVSIINDGSKTFGQLSYVGIDGQFKPVPKTIY